MIKSRTRALRRTLDVHSDEVRSVLRRYGASNPRLFGSVARGEATTDSDIDLLVDLDPGMGNTLLRIAGLSEELSQLLGVRVDVVSDEFLLEGVSQAARAEAVAL
ncbi:nucleotidyltransferase family protein [Phytoactinopolyspora halotolerans]|uniref:nucleotidyltransferase family protein n=1 Tax=Phytoactinopolyspora halotolerans TaxID=1981512 RepID=UPI0028A5F6CB|nr:nucleotidyltransferase domain-containing protein [Phytoactinopolyspora halotolerans]